MKPDGSPDDVATPYAAGGVAPGVAPVGQGSTDQALADLRQKQARRNRWSKIAGITLVLVILLRAGLALLPGAPQSCDDSDAQTSVEDILNKAYAKDGKAFKVVGLSQIVTVSKTDDLNTCTARAGFADKTSASVHYTISSKQIEARVDNGS